MRSYILQTFCVLLTLFLITVLSLLCLPANVFSEYWLRPTIIEKEAIAAGLASPRILIFGGSSVMFSIDAQAIERDTGVPAVNFGLHAGMRLDRILREADKVALPGDLVILALENYYTCNNIEWTPWALRNALAWDRDDFFGQSRSEQLRAVLTGGAGGLLLDQWVGLAIRFITGKIPSARAEAMESRDQVLSRWHSGHETPPSFEYSQFNIGPRGDMMQTNGSMAGRSGFTGKEDDGICPAIADMLTRFIATLKERGTLVVFAHHPYMIVDSPSPEWLDAEAKLVAAIKSTGSTMVDDRAELFFPPEAFFNMNFHLNSAARTIRTKRLVANLRRLRLVPAINE